MGLGEGSLLDKAKAETVKQTLDAIQKGGGEVQAEVLLDGSIEGDVNIPITTGPAILRGGTFTAFVKGKVQSLKDAVAGVRVTRKW